MLHIPILRRGQPYTSLDLAQVADCRTGEPFVEVSQANVGLIRRDLLTQGGASDALARYTYKEMIDVCRRAADHLAEDSLPLGDREQSPEEYVQQVSATTGLPYVLARNNLQKICTALSRMDDVIAGLTRQLDLGILDAGYGEVDGRALSFFRQAEALGVVLPSNSPGVHSLWAPAVALKTALVLKPGSAEPWTPYRMIQAFIRAGAPGEMFSYYPTSHEGASAILQTCGRGMLFGDTASLRPWQNDPRVELHGPGLSKIVIGEDCIEEWERYLEVMVSSIVDNAGRSCVNASSIRVPRYATEISSALAERLAAIQPRAADDEAAQLAPFTSAGVATRISRMIDAALAEPGAREVTFEYRQSPRLVSWEGQTYLLPTIIHCEKPDHRLANLELLFPFASVVETPEEDLPHSLGPTLVVTAITQDAGLIRKLTTSPLVGRLNLGPIPTNRIRWDQPHEGNLFEHLYGRRAFQSALAGVSP